MTKYGEDLSGTQPPYYLSVLRTPDVSKAVESAFVLVSIQGASQRGPENHF